MKLPWLNVKRTLADARSDWQDTIANKGGHCPCCDRWGRIYSRHFNNSMSKALIWLVENSDNGAWIDVPNKAPRWLTRTNQLSTVRWWDLAIRRESDDPAVKHSGMWQPTELGFDFVFNIVPIPKTVYTYNAKAVGFSTDKVFIEDTFKKRFDYQEIML